MKRWMAFLLMGVMLLTMLPALAQEEEMTVLEGKTATEIVAQMGLGWNLGNTLDATGGNTDDVTAQEQSWGNAVITPELMQRVKEAGFDTIRIPVTWYRYTSNDGTYTIREDFLQHVKEVVTWAREADLFVILNLHHEEWVNDPNLATNYVQIGEQLTAMWRQIADTFADFDQHVIFEGMNEPRAAGTSYEWQGNPDGYAAVSYLTQMFVNTVRKDAKGYNGQRCLMIPGYAASSSTAAMEGIAIPVVNGEAAENIIISVHCYNPQIFCLNDAQTTFDVEKDGVSIRQVFEDIRTLFLDKGIPVVMGETGATNTNGNHAERAKWARLMGEMSQSYGVPIIIWDNGNNQTSGGECHVWIRRKVNPKLRSQATSIVYPEVLEALFAGRDSVAWGSALVQQEETDTTAAGVIGGNVIWKSSTGWTSQKEWDYTYIQMGAETEWFIEGAKIGIRYTGSGEPKVVLDSAEKSAWWIPVDAATIEKRDNGEKIAWFTYEDMKREMEKSGVTAPEQLRYFSVLAANGAVTSYEIAVQGMAQKTLSYRVNGRVVAKGDAPETVDVPNMTFCGWYTTVDYQPGTELGGEHAVETDTVWAKMVLDMQVIK